MTPNRRVTWQATSDDDGQPRVTDRTGGRHDRAEGDRMTVRKIPLRNIALVPAAALLLVLFTRTASADACTVADPTGTPLNVRKSPSQHAPIIGALNNGITVSTRMSRGDWVHIVPHEAPGKSGWERNRRGRHRVELWWDNNRVR
jgi:hypothetical protein